MATLIRTLCAACAIGSASAPVEKWTEYRLAEMFSLPQTIENLEDFFTPEAFEAYQSSIAHDDVLSAPDEFHVVLDQFLTPIHVSAAENGQYAQAKFILNISNQHTSWRLPMEMILTISTNDGRYTIEHFEGISAEPIQVKQYQLDRIANCPV